MVHLLCELESRVNNPTNKFKEVQFSLFLEYDIWFHLMNDQKLVNNNCELAITLVQAHRFIAEH